ncbi:hypothetical protein ACU4HD_45805 (plasmid) [Cupriavidus basilensis]
MDTILALNIPPIKVGSPAAYCGTPALVVSIPASFNSSTIFRKRSSRSSDDTFLNRSSGEIEIPSDYLDVVRVAMDAGNGWRQVLGQELQAAGHDVDWNQVMRL